MARKFALKNEEQYQTIGAFWDEMEALYGLEKLRGLGYLWEGGYIYYAIGLKEGEISGWNFSIDLPEDGWVCVSGETACLQALYDEIYQNGALKYEIETFDEDGRCQILYYR